MMENTEREWRPTAAAYTPNNERDAQEMRESEGVAIEQAAEDVAPDINAWPVYVTVRLPMSEAFRLLSSATAYELVHVRRSDGALQTRLAQSALDQLAGAIGTAAGAYDGPGREHVAAMGAGIEDTFTRMLQRVAVASATEDVEPAVEAMVVPLRSDDVAYLPAPMRTWEPPDSDAG